MDKLEKYELVNSCETIESLKNAILMIAKDDTEFYYKQLSEISENSNEVDHNLPELLIQGRRSVFDANRMVEYVEGVVKENYAPNLLTREFGIRQQALYLRYYCN